jgi:hypothetical protein
MTDNDRPQDVGRSHRRQGAPGVETVAVLDLYQAAMRLELEQLLDELWPTSGQLTLVGDVERPPLDRRVVLWTLAVKLGRELASAPASSEPRIVPGSRRDQPAPRLTVTQRRALGQSGR